MRILDTKYAWLWVLLASFAFCIIGNGSSIIYVLDEAKNSEAAREMLFHRDWFRPTFNNKLRTDKPPFHYFWMMLGYKLFGINAFGARFFSSLFGGFTFMTTYVFAKKNLGIQVANITLGVLFSSFYFVQEFHLAVPDPYLIFWMSLTFFAYIEFYLTQQKKYLFLLYTAMGFGVLTKGPIAIVMPALVAFIHLIFYKKLTINAILKFKIFEGALWMLLICFPWFYFAHINSDGLFTQGFFFKHNLGRFQGKMEGHGGIFLITIGFVLLGMFPFCLWIFRALLESFQQKIKNQYVFFTGLVVVVFVSFFAISATKLPNYTMPCYPFIAVLLAWWLNKVYHQEKRLPWKHVEWLVLLFLCFSLPIVGYIGLDADKNLVEVKWLANVLWMVPIGVGIAYVWFLKNQYKASFLTLVFSFMLLSLFLFKIAFPVLTQHTPIVKYQQLVPKEVPVIVYQRMDAAFPINFNRTYKIATSLNEVNHFFNQHPNGVVITNTRNKNEINQLSIYKELFSQKSLFENHTTRVYVRPTN